MEKANSIKAKELNMLRETFSDGQKELMKKNVKRDDAVLLTNRNKILHWHILVQKPTWRSLDQCSRGD